MLSPFEIGLSEGMGKDAGLGANLKKLQGFYKGLPLDSTINYGLRGSAIGATGGAAHGALSSDGSISDTISSGIRGGTMGAIGGAVGGAAVGYGLGAMARHGANSAFASKNLKSIAPYSVGKRSIEKRFGDSGFLAPSLIGAAGGAGVALASPYMMEK